MLVDLGEMIHVIERRRFEGDVRRHFFGVVEGVSDQAVRLSGYLFVFVPGSSSFSKSKERRTRIIPLVSSGVILNVAPADTVLEEVKYVETNGRLSVTDGRVFSLDINEFSSFR